MKKTLLSCLFQLPLLLLLLPGKGIAQTYRIACQVVASAGGEGSFQGKNYAFTLGESVVATFDGAGSATVLTQGFHQPECSDAPLTGVENWEPDFQVDLFPNPASEVLWLQISPVPTSACTVQVFDLLGQAVSLPVALQAGERLPVDVSALPPGWYFLQVGLQRQAQLTTLPFVKMN